METITVKEVDGPNSNGWYEVLLDDGRKVSTKDEAVAKAAFQSRDVEAEAVISSQTKGKFTNVYLNQINGVGETRPKKPAAKPAASTGRDPATNDRIARQWAYGRATELLIGSGAEFVFPLDSKTMSDLSEVASGLLNATKE